jgi:hypothetical protein
MTVALRPHHLLCLLTYVGRGYSPAFTENYDAIAARLVAGESVVLVAGPDDICQPLLGEAEPHCHRDSVVERDWLATRDVERLLGRPLSLGVELALTPEWLRRMRDAFSRGETREACGGCEWHGLCTGIAGSGYAGVKLA